MQNDLKYAGFWIRAVADLIDSIILDLLSGAIELAGIGLLFWIQILSNGNEGADLTAFYESVDPFKFQIVFALIRVACSLIYYPILTYRTGSTLGKMLFRVYVVSVNGTPVTLQQSFVRCIAYVLSYIPLGAGFLMAAFHPQKRALHDLIAGTISIIRPPNEAPVQNLETPPSAPDTVI